MTRALAMLLALVLLLPQSGPAAASAMPEAPNCPIYQPDDVWHSLVQGLPVLAFFGAALAWLRSRTQSVLPGMILHAVFNGATLVLAVST